MAAKAKDGDCRKEKSGLSPSTPKKIDVAHVRRTPTLSVSGSSDQHHLIPLQKLAPNYLKPTISFSNEICKYANRQASLVVSLKFLPSRKSFDKPPSPSQNKKTPLSATSEEKLLRSSSSSAKTMVSPIPSSHKTLKTVKGGKIQPLAKTRSLKKEASNARKRKATESPSENEKPNDTCDWHAEEELADEVVVEIVQTSEAEHGHLLEIPAMQDQAPPDPGDSELKIIYHEKLEVFCDGTDPTTEEVEDEKEEYIHNKDEEDNGDGGQDEEVSEGSIDIDREDGFDERVIVQRVRAVSIDFTKLKFRRGKVIDGEESDDVRCKKLKFKVREETDMESIEDSPNVMLKHQRVQEKREAVAFNDVIEETASKLVEERKSMVKALVGAFETVILLQEPDGQGPQAMDDDSRVEPGPIHSI